LGLLHDIWLLGKSIVMLVRHSGHKHADAPNAPRLLRLRGERPRGPPRRRVA
jgi:hypothetical protein